MFHYYFEVFSSVDYRFTWRSSFYFVVLSLTSFLLLPISLESYSFWITARICSILFLIVELCFLWMTWAVIHFSTYKFLVTVSTLEVLEPSKHFYENVLPRNIFLPQKQNKFVNVPMFITLMLGYNFAITINKEIRLGALHPLSLITSIECTAVDTPIEHIVLFLEQVL